MPDSSWSTAQHHEAQWWDKCLNTYGEETKQLEYAELMGLEFHHRNGIPYIIDMQGKSVLDIGGGPVSLLLKCVNLGRSVVADPCLYPDWVYSRYRAAGIRSHLIKGEELDFETGSFDEVWIYNVLQHTQDPDKVLDNAMRIGNALRIFEWVDSEVNEMHPHSITQKYLEDKLGIERVIYNFNGESGLMGQAWSAWRVNLHRRSK